MRSRFFLITLLSLLTFSSNIFAQFGATIDPTFAPALSKENSEVFAYSSIQPDGKIIVSGSFHVANSTLAPGIARLNVDGTTDNSFNCASCNFPVVNTLVQPDGKILVSGYSLAATTAKSKIIRLNADGSLDNTFNFQGLFNSGSTTVEVKQIQSDGKIYVIENLTGFQLNAYYLYRLNADGSIDNSFTQITANGRARQSINVKIFPDGRVFVFGNNNYGVLAQINNDGSKNTSYQSPVLTPGPSDITPGSISDIALQTDGKIVVVGYFNTVNGISRVGAARINPDQGVDMSFSPTVNATPQYGVNRVFAVSNNKLLFVTASPNISRDIERRNYDGSLDTTFDFSQDLQSIYNVTLDSAERIYLSGSIVSSQGKFLRFNPNGSLDTSFNPRLDTAGQVSAVKLQADGKLLVGGSYGRANGVSRAYVSRLNTDGTTDANFDTENKFIYAPETFAVQSDGKVLAGGNFLYEGVSKQLVRLNANGSKDAAFDVIVGSNSTVYGIAVQPDGKILIAGAFGAVNGFPRSGLARLNADGTLDTSFNAQLGGAAIYSMILQGDGKIVIAGTFSGVNGFNRANFARLNGDGSLDAGFNAVSSSLSKVILQSDGKYLTLSSTGIVKRFNSNGSDAVVVQGTENSGVLDMELLNDGSIVLVGSFTAFNGQSKNRIVRLQPNGTVDGITFVKGANNIVRKVIKQADGKIIIGGDFTAIEDVIRTGIARLSVAAFARPTNFDFDGDGRADIGVYRPSTSVWYRLTGANYQFSDFKFGIGEDILAPADYDGDGKTDLGIFRPSTGVWWYTASTQGNAFRAVQSGQTGDIPLPSDIDGDGKSDYVVYRPSQSRWYRKTALNVDSTIDFGTAGDKPVIGDFDGDGKADAAIYRPSTGVWWFAASSQNNAHRAVQFGISTDLPVAADYDGDGKTDFAVYRASTGVWYILNSGSGSATIIQFGTSEDKPVAADYDGDGKADIAVYRPSNGGWYLLRSTAGFTGLQFGVSTDRAIPNAFVP